jgi:glutaminase
MLASNMTPGYETDEIAMKKKKETMDLYFKTQAIITDVMTLAKFGAMIANNGNNCSTGESCLKYFISVIFNKLKGLLP